jgi:REP element-mobilizing transposase RayT
MPFKKYKSLRLKEYDYSQPGAYFVTICVKNRKSLFGNIKNEQMILNEPGEIAKTDIAEIPGHYENIEIGENIVMPNHIHMVVYIYDSIGDRQAMPPTNEDKNCNGQVATRTKSIRLQDIVGSYKSGVTGKVRLIKGFEKFSWQRYYFDHIVRSERGLENISDYIRLNPAKWAEDIENELYLKDLNESKRKKEAEKFYKNLIK